MSTASFVGFFLLGVVLWTALEWLIHGKAGHRKKAKNPFAKEHAKHHATTSYIAGWPIKFVIVTPASLLVWGALMPVMGKVNAAGLVAGLALMYLYYEAVHRSIHRRAPRNRYDRWIRIHHVYHHFHNPQQNWGVTSPLWDKVFGTYVKVELPVSIPEKHVFPWMLDPDTGDLAAAYADDYVIRQRRRDGAPVETG